MDFSKVEKSYELIKQEYIEDIHAQGCILKHRKTGANIMLLENEDENKVFNIIFPTAPKDSTGVAHIIEHSVLCGSAEFPLKDPFVELVKGSLNTFLNAMTYPEKTMYPVASCNDKDFQNLMHVYLDAVFFPRIYQREEIFRQEGWHYHMESPEEPLTYNGVVYNEMKGAFSDVEELLERQLYNQLFPDNLYGVESGGDPDCIPELSYEEFLNFHRTYYHPSNSYIYLYGKMDMAEKLLWIDEHYLSRFERAEVDSKVVPQKPFEKAKELTVEYPILDSAPLEENTYLYYAAAVGTQRDILQCTAFEILEYALVGAPGAKLKQALLDAKIGKDVSGGFDDSVYQPVFSLMAKNAESADKERFCKIIRDTLEEIAENGVDKKALEAGINYFEFKFREADFASYPKGLIYGLDVIDSWLYCEDNPWGFLKLLDIFKELKEKVHTGYFEELIRTELLDNPHTVVLTGVPKKGLEAEKEAALEKKLADYKAGLSEEEKQAIVEKTHALKAYQEEEEKPEDLARIPMLKRTDIRKEIQPLDNQEYTVDNMRILFHETDANGIAYLKFLFDCEEVPTELVPYLGILKAVIGMVDTEHYSYTELFHEINAKSGGIACGLHVFPGESKELRGSCRKMFGVKAKCLNAQMDFVCAMVREMLTTSRLTDTKRLYEIVARMKSRAESMLQSAGHSTAMGRAAAQFSPAFRFQEQTGGIAFFRLLEELEAHFEERKEELIEKLSRLIQIVFHAEHLMIDLTGDAKSLEKLKKEVSAVREALLWEKPKTSGDVFVPEKEKEAFVTPGQVQYVAVAGNFCEAGFSYTGALRIAKMMFNYDYGWLNIRVKGGAYGCMSGFRRNGDSFLASYRDPKLAETLDVYRGLPEYLKSFEADERELTKLIIGTMSELDVPLTPSTFGTLSMNVWFTGLTDEERQKERDEILQAKLSDIHALAELVQALLDQQHICVVGTKSAIEEHEELFDRKEELIS